MTWLLRNLPTWQGRLLAGLTMVVVAVATTIAIVQPGAPIAAKVTSSLALIPAIVAWLIASIAGANTPYPHDLRLFDRVMTALSEEQRRFLRGHDFGNDFERSSLLGVSEISTWQGSSFEFLDRSVERKWRLLRAEIDNLRDHVARGIAPKRGDTLTRTVHTDDGDPEDPSPQVAAKIEDLNSAANSVTRLTDEFEPFARRRLMV